MTKNVYQCGGRWCCVSLHIKLTDTSSRLGIISLKSSHAKTTVTVSCVLHSCRWIVQQFLEIPTGLNYYRLAWELAFKTTAGFCVLFWGFFLIQDLQPLTYVEVEGLWLQPLKKKSDLSAMLCHSWTQKVATVAMRISLWKMEMYLPVMNPVAGYCSSSEIFPYLHSYTLNGCFQWLTQQLVSGGPASCAGEN